MIVAGLDPGTPSRTYVVWLCACCVFAQLRDDARRRRMACEPTLNSNPRWRVCASSRGGVCRTGALADISTCPRPAARPVSIAAPVLL